MTTTTISQFDQKSLSEYPCILVVGNTSEAQTSLLQRVLPEDRLKEQKKIVVFANEKHVDHWNTWAKEQECSDIDIITGCKEDDLAALLREQESRTERKLLILLEDFGGKLIHSKSLEELFYNGRRLWTSLICCTHFLRPTMYHQYDYCFMSSQVNSIPEKFETEFKSLSKAFQQCILHNASKKSGDRCFRKSLYNLVGHYFDSEHHFWDTLEAVSKRKKWLVLDATQPDRDEPNMFWFNVSTP